MRVCLLSVFVASWMSSVLGLSIEIHPAKPLVNGSVILEVLDIIGTFRYSEWYRGQGTNATNQIIRINDRGNVANGVRFFSEASIFSNGSLKISNAQRSHEGYYTVSVQADQLLQYTVNLMLYDPNRGLTPGEIVGIVVGVLAGVALIIGLVVYFYKKTSSSTVPEK